MDTRYGKRLSHSFYFSSMVLITVNCGDPGTPTNGRRLGDNFLFTSNVTFVCDEGYYQSSGPVGGVRRCLISGEWSDQQPVCSRKLETGCHRCGYIMGVAIFMWWVWSCCEAMSGVNVVGYNNYY